MSTLPAAYIVWQRTPDAPQYSNSVLSPTIQTMCVDMFYQPVVPDPPLQVTLYLQSNQQSILSWGAAKLIGTTTLTTDSAGMACFSDVGVDTVGLYNFVAATTGLRQNLSFPSNIINIASTPP